MELTIVAIGALILVASAAGALQYRSRRSKSNARATATPPKQGTSPAQRPAETKAPSAEIESYRVRDPQAPGRDLLVEFIPATLSMLVDESSPPTIHRGHALRNALDAVIDTLPKAAALIESGMTMRVVGPPEALSGLASGALELVSSGGRSLGMARDPGSGQIAAHLRLAKAGVTPAGGVLAIFHAMSVVTGQYYLHRIDTQLGEINQDLRHVLRGQTAEAYGKAEAAAKLNEQVRANLLDSIPPNQSDFSDLDHAEQLVLAAYGETRKKLTDFLAETKAVAIPGTSRRELTRLWDRAKGEVLEDANVLAYAAFVRHQNNLLALAIEPQGDPLRAENIQERLDRERKEMLSDIAVIRKAYDNLSVSALKLRESFRFSGKVVKASNAFRNRTRKLRSLARNADTNLLPAAPTPDLSFMAEVRQADSGELQVTAATLRSTGARSPTGP